MMVPYDAIMIRCTIVLLHRPPLHAECTPETEECTLSAFWMLFSDIDLSFRTH